MTEAVIRMPMVKKHASHTSSTSVDVAERLDNIAKKINNFADSDDSSSSLVYEREGVFTSVKFFEVEEKRKK